MQRIIKNNEVVDETWHLLPKDFNIDEISNCDDLIVTCRPCGANMAVCSRPATVAWACGWMPMKKPKKSVKTRSSSRSSP